MIQIDLPEFDAGVVWRTLIEFQKDLVDADYDSVAWCLELITDKLSVALNEASEERK